jgi:cellulose synthase/poly-beta-1,6-N-acetylglucosamine synthase-like glycosyltransferase
MPENAFPHISVIVPVYNCECCLGHCLERLLAQDYDRDILIHHLFGRAIFFVFTLGIALRRPQPSLFAAVIIVTTLVIRYGLAG